MSDELVIDDLHVSVEGKPIIKGFNLRIKQGEIHALMGPNGSGKSTLSNALMGHPHYDVDKGTVTFNGTPVLELEPNERARLGLFLAFQYPTAIPGVTMANFPPHGGKLRALGKFKRKRNNRVDSHARISPRTSGKDETVGRR